MIIPKDLDLHEVWRVAPIYKQHRSQLAMPKQSDPFNRKKKKEKSDKERIFTAFRLWEGQEGKVTVVFDP